MSKPSLDEFEDTIRKAGGNLSAAAGMLGVSRRTIHNWLKEDEAFKTVVEDARKRVFDKCLDTAYAVAMGVPIIDERTGRFVAWREKPDSAMLRYLLATLGRDEGFNDRVNVSVDNPLPQVIQVVTSRGAGTEEKDEQQDKDERKNT